MSVGEYIEPVFATFGETIALYCALALLWIVLILTATALIGSLIYLVYFVLTLPIRRSERGRLLIHLIEVSLGQKQNLERTIIEAADRSERLFGRGIHLLRAQLHSGIRLVDALHNVPNLLPRQVLAMLRAGERTGDLGSVLPACKRFLRDGLSQARGAHNYLMVLAFGITPLALFVPLMLQTRVWPKLAEVSQGLTEQPLPEFTRLVIEWTHYLVWVQEALLAFLVVLMICYAGGPHIRRLADEILPGVADAVALMLPWRRKRMQRDLSSTLAELLDAGVPEPEALTLAAAATGNRVLIARAKKAVTQLKAGTGLVAALGVFDNSGEFHWRLRNATHAHFGFNQALAGWHEALDAKAFQLEQSAAQSATTALVIFNGIVVGLHVFAVFLFLTKAIDYVALW
jgi:type II secretory pathway component PulF